MKRIVFSKNAWDDYTSWLKEDRRMLKKINDLIKEVQRMPFEGRGRPEALKYDLAGYWSRRIDREHRLVYRVVDEELQIVGCKFHYDK